MIRASCLAKNSLTWLPGEFQELPQSPLPGIGWGNADFCSNRFFTVPLCHQDTASRIVPLLSTCVSLEHWFKSPKDFLFKAPSPLHGILRWHQVLWSLYLRDEADIHFAPHPPHKPFRKMPVGVIYFQGQLTPLKDGWNPFTSLQSDF